MLIVTLFIIFKNWRQLIYSLAGEGINKLWYTRTMDYFRAVKRNEILILATTRVNLNCEIE